MRSIGLLMILLLFCSGCQTQKIEPKVSFYEGDSWIIDKKTTQDYTPFLSDTSISNKGSFLFGGKNESPFEGRYRNEIEIIIDCQSKEKTEVFVFSYDKNLNCFEFDCRILLKEADIPKKVKVPKKDILRVADVGAKGILLVKNGKPIVRYIMILSEWHEGF